MDTHCHIQFKAFDKDREEVIKKCKEVGVILNAVGTQMDTSKKAVELAEAHDNIYATVGLHPIQRHKVKVEEEDTEFIARGEEFDTEYFEKLIKSSDKVIAIGETGLDGFHVPRDQSLHEVLDKQWELFLRHAELAKKHNLPLVIHVRDAQDEMIKRRKYFKIEVPGVIHCYSGNWEQAQEYLNLGFYLGFTGVVTFPAKKTDLKPQEKLLEVIKKIPLDRILIETDAPYLAPQKYRGKRCEPWMVEEVAEFISKVRGIKLQEFVKLTSDNAKKLFGIN